MNEKDHRLDDYFVQYKDMVFRNIILYVDYHTAEDLCQETFIRLSEKREKVDHERIREWLLVVSEHLALDHLKRGGKIQTIIGLEPEKTEIPDLRLDTVLLAEEREESRRKYNVLFRLKMEKRDWYDALILKYVGHMSDKEISEKKGIRHSLVGKWRQRGREQLRKWYENEYSERDR